MVTGPQLSTRIQSISPSPIRKLVPLADEAKARGVKVYHMNIGQPDIETPEAFYTGIEKRRSKVISYAPSQGIAEYQDALVEYYSWYNINIERKNIIVTTGGSEAIIFTVVAVCDAGDEIIIPEPYYANYNGFTAMGGVKVVPVRTYLKDGFRLPCKDDIEAKITARTKAILVCSPHNPTGVVYGKEDEKKLVDLALKHNLFIISDEVYREFNYVSEPGSMYHYPEVRNNLVIVDSISKRYSACGLRIGCLVTQRDDVIANAMKLAQARLSPPTLGEWGATEALTLGREYFQTVASEYKARIDVVCNKLDAINGVSYHKPEGAFYLIAALKDVDAEEFCAFLLRDFCSKNPITGIDETMMVAPASGFYSQPDFGSDEIRIAVMLKAADSARAIDILAEALITFRNK